MGHAVMKVEGVLPAAPKNVYKFLQLSTKDGGKVKGVWVFQMFFFSSSWIICLEMNILYKN